MVADEARQVAAHQGRLLALVGEVARREAWRDDGAASVEDWIAQCCGRRAPGAPNGQDGEQLEDLPHLGAALSSGEVSLDKVRTVAPLATPETDAELARAARTRSVGELAEWARARARPKPKGDEGRQWLRFNEGCRTMTAQLRPETFAELRAVLEARAKKLFGEAESPLDERLADALVELVRGGRPGAGRDNSFLVVAHVRLSDLFDDDAEPSTLVGELERGGYLSVATVRRLLCDATMVIGVDDDEGHTMYEGRQVRDATATQRREIMRRDRHCRFPGCDRVTFTNPHHIKEWKRDGGPTDIDNLCCLCEHHHGLVHRNAWSLRGNPNEELTFSGPSGQVLTSRPSPLWTAMTGPDP